MCVPGVYATDKYLVKILAMEKLLAIDAMEIMPLRGEAHWRATMEGGTLTLQCAEVSQKKDSL